MPPIFKMRAFSSGGLNIIMGLAAPHCDTLLQNYDNYLIAKNNPMFENAYPA
jgi:hypothetical protein